MDKERESKLEIQTTDIAVSTLKSTLGILPIVGPFMVELIGYTIPNQRFERLVKYCSELDKKLEKIDSLLLKDENFTDLLEESLWQSVRSLSDERRQYIASLIANSLSQERIDYVESKQILRILGEINDIEIIWLRFYACPYPDGDEEFRQKHENILDYEHAHLQSPQYVHDKDAIQKCYRDHLIQLGLLKPNYETMRFNQSTLLPVIDPFSKTQQISNYEITSLGTLLLRYIDLEYNQSQ